MGGASSTPEKKHAPPAHSSSAEGDYMTVAKIPHNGGKFLMRTSLNKGINDTDGGFYLSCDVDGNLCSKTTENDPELWRLLYTDQAIDGLPKGVNAFRLLNTGRKRVLQAGGDGKMYSVPYDEKTSGESSEIFYFEKIESTGSSKKSGPSSVEQYFICTHQGSYISQGTDGRVSHVPLKSDDVLGSITWTLLPSF